MLNANYYFDLTLVDRPILDLLKDVEPVWSIIDKIPEALRQLLPRGGQILGDVHPNATLVDETQIFVGAGAVIESGAFIRGPAYIGPGCHVRHGAYVRGNVVVGKDCVLGHASEFKNCVMLDRVSAAHFAYVGDSILGSDVNLGAGTKLSNFGMLVQFPSKGAEDRTVRLRLPGELGDRAEGGTVVDTGMVKLGAVLGDNVKLGCNVVTNPGCFVGPECIVYPGVVLQKGFWPGQHIIKLRQDLETVSIDSSKFK